MSLKRKYEDVESEGLGEEEEESEYEVEEEEEFEFDEDEEEPEDYGHVRNLKNGLQGDRSPPNKRAKTELSSQEPDKKAGISMR